MRQGDTFGRIRFVRSPRELSLMLILLHIGLDIETQVEHTFVFHTV